MMMFQSPVRSKRTDNCTHRHLFSVFFYSTVIRSDQRPEVNLNNPKRVAMTACVCGGTSAYGRLWAQTHAVTAAGLLMISIPTA